MHRLRSHSYLILAGLTLAAVLIGGVLGVRKTLAEFEVPLVNTDRFTPVHFYDIYAQYRASRHPVTLDPNDATGTVYEFANPVAIGQADSVPLTPLGGAFRLWNNTWQQIMPFAADDSSVTYGGSGIKKYYAIAGQYDAGAGYAPLWAGGQTLFPFGPFITFSRPTSVAQPQVWRIASDFHSLTSELVNVTPTGQTIYTIEAFQEFGTRMFAGGSQGLFLEHTRYYCNNDPARCPGIILNDQWTGVNIATLPWGLTDDVTDIAFGSHGVAFVAITNFTAAGQSPHDHVCTGRTSHVYRVRGSPNVLTNWTDITGPVSGCFYRLAVQPNGVQPADGGPMLHRLWVATNTGVRTIDESAAPSSGTLTNTPAGEQLFGITAVPIRTGNVNILPNGNFESWQTPNPPIGSSTINPDIWLLTDQPIGKNNDSGTCGINERDIMITNGASGVDRAIRIAPGIYYGSQSNCESNTNPQYNNSGSVYHHIPLTNIEGTKFRISGKYSVTFTGAPQAQFPQGGVLIQCAGAQPPSSVDCSLSNFSRVRTINQGDTGGFVEFSMDISRQDLQLQKPLLGGTSGPRVAASGQVLEIRCYGTYGAAVVCDDLQVEVINEPGQIVNFNATVVAVGEQGLIMTNENALNASAFTVEASAIPGSSSLNAVGGITPNLIYAVGDDGRLLQRNAGNVTGYIWAGTASPTQDDGMGTVTERRSLGWISASCINHRDAQERTLCQRARESFGLSVEGTRLVGRAFVAKNYAPGKPHDDRETLELGQCVGAARLGSLGMAQPYQMTGSCNTSTRTCFADSSRACFRDFDCYGRCAGDNGYLCLYDADCSIGAADESPSGNLSGSRLSRPPSDSLTCVFGSPLNPQSCTAGGWLSFNRSDTGDATGVAGLDANFGGRNFCPGGGACFNLTTSQFQGVGRFMTLANTNDPNGAADRGWVSLRGPGGQTPTYISLNSNQYLFGCKECTIVPGSPPTATCKFCNDADGHSCQSAGNCTNYCEGVDPDTIDVTQPCVLDEQCAIGKACRPAGFCSEDPDTQCTEDSVCVGKGYCAIGATCLADIGDQCSLYGVNLDTITGQLSGYAWSSDYGWLDFRGASKGTRRFIQTRLGDVYSQQNVGDVETLPAPAGTCNATYVISATGTINNFCSSFLVDNQISYETILPLADFIPFASARNQFENALGRIDLIGLETNVGSNRNKFGSSIITLPSSGDIRGSFSTSSGGHTLANQVYIAGSAGSTADFSIDSSLKFRSAQSTSDSGAGVIIINGNLRIDGDVTYASNTITDLRQLANVVVIVKGNLIIKNQVSKVAGNYYVTGAVCTGGELGDGNNPCNYAQTTENSFPLEVRGVMIANEFFLARTFAGTIENPLPSELFINNGRLQVNPPPGLQDFAASLPSSLNTGP